MKMYHFNYNGYGAFFLVMANSPEEALESLKEYLRKNVKAKRHQDCRGGWYVDFDYERYLKWKDCTVDKLPKDYDIEVFEKNEVFRGEWS